MDSTLLPPYEFQVLVHSSYKTVTSVSVHTMNVNSGRRRTATRISELDSRWQLSISPPGRFIPGKNVGALCLGSWVDHRDGPSGVGAFPIMLSRLPDLTSVRNSCGGNSTFLYR